MQANQWAEAIAAGDAVRGTTSPNPPVGCALYSPSGEVIATGATSPVGGPHAEINALRAAGEKARGAHAVVTLEPCNHQGRTGPCSHALEQAGIAKLTYFTADPNPAAAGGADYLRARGVDVEFLPRPVEALQPWLTSVREQRVSVTAKFAATVDGFTAAVDGTSKWITGPAARDFVHEDRETRDAIVVGTETVLADDPSLTARYPDGSLRKRQPVRVVVGKRKVPEGHLSTLGFVQYPNPEEAMAQLWDQGIRDVLVEGGATLLTSFFELGVVDRIQAYVAPMLLGQGRPIVETALAGTIRDAHRFSLTGVRTLGNDVLIEMER
ncbi:bifunctional diaminohydroxyphosphoribosylaminopyrimidine deaminase/5-amino-6-(5-phosphoribosylamino)uracil reductase RibD [Corynebacterium sp.]|uniref:bifunctional diaminohydroxyphosphoribosylaminopyrimidine deaminase/5-amino-6-(5-phosphoribosylamino)uracil reductase RibD n=1 Tax=Corynebacterium sp. TaxID=1720 RepID=UPI002A916B34|nr:bifunctional diaminohydroxyphosphoribosylaminopyrimidine deaminase/5-amino-6-(5-phosphoribosylamino)uracil reductase RibD [Corynebacterium sp.]MDY5786175.1 bifunctional diaminohydroxyphosphoribosylaminopyrimidine deaminase/5-amino-6-(5-phosphoribosylamino)uracil reductase RibD [Corynebacterium sp.]